MTWCERYEKAYMAANGHRAHVVICGGGWYRIATGLQEKTTRLRRKQIEEMTFRLELRMAGTTTPEPASERA